MVGMISASRALVGQVLTTRLVGVDLCRQRTSWSARVGGSGASACSALPPKFCFGILALGERTGKPRDMHKSCHSIFYCLKLRQLVRFCVGQGLTNFSLVSGLKVSNHCSQTGLSQLLRGREVAEVTSLLN